MKSLVIHPAQSGSVPFFDIFFSAVDWPTFGQIVLWVGQDRIKAAQIEQPTHSQCIKVNEPF